MNKPEPFPSVAAAPGGRIGILLVNLGTPEAPTAAALRVYLREFLGDARVIENQGLVWKLVLNGVILPIRPRLKARDYAAIWNRERNESPLKTITRAQAEKLSLELSSQAVIVDWAMRYGEPSLASRLDALVQAGCDRIVLMPLYPQYAAATTATVCDAAFAALIKMRVQPSVRVMPPYYSDPVYIDALGLSVDRALAQLPFKPDVVLASFHGVPQEYIDKGDPYARQCAETARLLRQRLNRSETQFMLTFQSRFGRAEWVKPYTADTVKRLAKSGVQSIAVITPGFSADCLETLEEIAQENAEIFRHNGGEEFSAIPCLNDSDPGMDVIRQLVLRELQGWI